MDIGQRKPLLERILSTVVVVRRLQKKLKSKHHFTTANCPWSSSTIEFACKEVIRPVRAVLSVLKLCADEWFKVVNLVQSVLNNFQAPRRNKRTPMKICTENAETTPLALIMKENMPVTVPLDFINAQKLMEVEKLATLVLIDSALLHQ
jgi:hypothetical protein